MLVLLKCILSFIYILNINFSFSHDEGLNSEVYRNNKKLTDYASHKVNENSYILKYDRKSFRYRSYATKSDMGYYTKKICNTNIDHVVSLKDAHDSGAAHWPKSLKEKFANDKFNHVESCSRVNSSKGSSIPKDFLRKSRDGKGLEYDIISFCSYLKIYFKVKVKYELSFEKNDLGLFSKCDLQINN